MDAPPGAAGADPGVAGRQPSAGPGGLDRSARRRTDASEAGTLGSLADLLAARRVLEPLLERVVWAERRSSREESIVQLRLKLAESAAPAVALWELIGEPERQRAMTLLAALIAQTVAGEEVGDERRTGAGPWRGWRTG